MVTDDLPLFSFVPADAASTELNADARCIQFFDDEASKTVLLLWLIIAAAVEDADDDWGDGGGDKCSMMLQIYYI